MVNEFRVIAVDSRLNISSRFHQTPICEAQLNKQIINKMNFVDGDLLEIKGKRTTTAKLISSDKDSLGIDEVGLNNLIRNNAWVIPEETVLIKKAEPKKAKKIVLAPIEKHLEKIELLRMVAKVGFLNKPFVEGDVTYLRSKIMRYLRGAMIWLRVVKTDPDGVVVVNDNTDIEIIPDPVNQNPSSPALYYLPDLSSDNDSWEKDLFLNDNEWNKINSTLELGIFKTISEAVSFFLREGIKARSEIFEKTLSVVDQIEKLKENIKTPL